MKRIITITLLGICISLSGMAQKSNDPKLLAIVEELGSKMETLAVKRDIDAIVEMYSEKAEYLPDGDKIYVGKDQIRVYWEKTFQMEIKDFQMTTKTVGGHKKLIYETGIGVSKVIYNGQNAEIRFKYVNVWELQKKGGYKLIVDIYNKDVAGQ